MSLRELRLNSIFRFVSMSLLLNFTTHAETNRIYKWVGDTNLVVTVAGYQTSHTLPSGIEIPVFSVNNEHKGNEKGVLFYVVAPTNYSGFFFWMHHDGVLASGQLTSLYMTNTLYYFSFQRNGGRHGDLDFETLHDLQSVMVPGASLCSVGGAIGWQYFTSRNDAEIYLATLLKAQEKAKNDTTLAEERLKNAEKPPPQNDKGHPELTLTERRKKYPVYYKARMDLLNLGHAIRCRAFEIVEVQHQIERMSTEDE